MIILRKVAIILFVTIATAACKNRPNNLPKTPVSEAKKKFEVVNRALVDKDRERIEAYISRHRLEGMEENKSGLYYLVWGEGHGPKAKAGDIVLISYKISMLDGTELYSSETDKPKEFLVGKGGVEAGLEMAILHMQQGQKGKFILPPHLGHGLLGDSDRIPPMAVLVFDVELLAIIES
ncbi:MAG: FKBP-type peptidyl-prolyl cis-trans isomerase [Bacteroidales bacterium]|nr:FKBP-type peptidyl-prolyl cis-trans isomerase [Bacteroidales bacterium]MDY0255203.1 FKBP-type peptidyl-prolyl cis-trans isomerase [Tenuifilaceae bacterium]